MFDNESRNVNAPLLQPKLKRVQTFDKDGGSLDVYRRSLLPVGIDEDTAVISCNESDERIEPYDGPNTFGSTSISLSKVILGSGMLVIPKAFLILGIPTGMVVLALVGLLTWYTINGLVHAAEQTGKNTYASVVRTCCGHPAKWGILGAVFSNCLGMCTVCIIFADILIGDPEEPDGLITVLIPGLPQDSLALNRKAVLAVLTGAVLLPLTLPRNLTSLSFLNAMGVGSVVAFAMSTTLVAGAAAFKGEAHALPMLPDWSRLGESPLAIGAALLAIAPILLNADICHQSVFPLMSVLKPFSKLSFSRMTALSLMVCNLLYTLIAVTSILAFGPDLGDDALSNMSAVHLEPLIGVVGASIVGCVVRLGYFVSLVGSFILTLHPLRHCVLEIILGSNFETESTLEKRLFLPVTLGLLLACYSMAVLIPSIWVVISLVGSVASTLMGFIFPAIVILATVQVKVLLFQH
ncbi:hypothetical protein CEUSTIGMA_g10036.t1 [Chlamydomonas eustigma]|uniref:Amino acid transporter transmembrane domain-containing protein n=1 Tax=Chlamydomonas eustigma TaxID=1157962 RepID=A0A250XIJ1_9CHLO|nr:hypothetical protein CEUSTIGMA_g10036.t1 [Chlamydomonas eustigma]|eukprot:GAX82610.1 hypothetical protein CEUSTIGMA_g10036.t1 [Chlamydomonas eustigma]